MRLITCQLSALLLSVSLFSYSAELSVAFYEAPVYDSPPQQESSAFLRCSACEELVKVLARAVVSPNLQLRGQRILETLENGRDSVEVEYVDSKEYIYDLLDVLCERAPLSQFKPKRDWLGRLSYEFDSIPSYRDTAARPAESRLRSICDAFVTEARKDESFVSTFQRVSRSASLDSVASHFCTKTLLTCPHKMSYQNLLSSLISEAMTESLIVLRLLPLIMTAVLLIAVLSPPNWMPAKQLPVASGHQTLSLDRSAAAQSVAHRQSQKGRKKRE
eukprot:TRINITY_DN21936_c0_g1_i1.p1 TRINITY_DN21936_c0_g1~~TRINITY_DN21936_c0_g1_i1.p1  ORF type:complete len:275 (+),score=20.23 TRINITY_DN21936_c0_g1_i1:408-1232(+)